MLKIKSTKYNEYVIDFVVEFTDGRSVNVQYDPAFSNIGAKQCQYHW